MRSGIKDVQPQDMSAAQLAQLELRLAAQRNAEAQLAKEVAGAQARAALQGNKPVDDGVFMRDAITGFQGEQKPLDRKREKKRVAQKKKQVEEEKDAVEEVKEAHSRCPWDPPRRIVIDLLDEIAFKKARVEVRAQQKDRIDSAPPRPQLVSQDELMMGSQQANVREEVAGCQRQIELARAIASRTDSTIKELVKAYPILDQAGVELATAAHNAHLMIERDFEIKLLLVTTESTLDRPDLQPGHLRPVKQDVEKLFRLMAHQRNDWKAAWKFIAQAAKCKPIVNARGSGVNKGRF